MRARRGKEKKELDECRYEGKRERKSKVNVSTFGKEKKRLKFVLDGCQVR